MKNRIDYSFEYDSMLYRDIEMDLKKENKPGGKKTRVIKGQKTKSKRVKK